MTNPSIIDRHHFALAARTASFLSCFRAGIATAIGAGNRPALDVGQRFGLIGADFWISAALHDVAAPRRARPRATTA